MDADTSSSKAVPSPALPPQLPPSAPKAESDEAQPIPSQAETQPPLAHTSNTSQKVSSFKHEVSLEVQPEEQRIEPEDAFGGDDDTSDTSSTESENWSDLDPDDLEGSSAEYNLDRTPRPRFVSSNSIYTRPTGARFHEGWRPPLGPGITRPPPPPPRYAIPRPSSTLQPRQTVPGSGLRSLPGLPDEPILPPLKNVTAVLDPTRESRDLVVTLELDVFDDLEEELEEFSRLRRLGRFNDAKQWFRRRLQGHIDNPYVFVQYAEMLLDQGDYGTFDSLAKNPPVVRHVEGDTDRYLRLNLMLQTMTRNRYDYRRPDPQSLRVTNSLIARVECDLDLPFALDSLILYSFLCLSEDWENLSIFIEPLGSMYKPIFQALYAKSIAQVRVWDAGYIIVLLSSVLDQRRVGQLLFNTDNPTQMIEKLLAEWEWKEADETTHMALMDTIGRMAYLAHGTKNFLETSATYTSYAEAIATFIMMNDPQLMRSRQFVRLILAKSHQKIFTTLAADTASKEKLNGLYLLRTSKYYLPVFVPFQGGPIRWPRWDTIKVPSSSSSTEELIVALKTAKALGDYALQAVCLQHLVLTAHNPWEWLKLLANLQLSVQHDDDGYLATLLSGFLVNQDPIAHQELLSKLESFQSSSRRFKPSLTLLWAEAVITFAFSSSPIAQTPQMMSHLTHILNKRIPLSLLPPYIRRVHFPLESLVKLRRQNSPSIDEIFVMRLWDVELPDDIGVAEFAEDGNAKKPREISLPRHSHKGGEKGEKTGQSSRSIPEDGRSENKQRKEPAKGVSDSTQVLTVDMLKEAGRPPKRNHATTRKAPSTAISGTTLNEDAASQPSERLASAQQKLAQIRRSLQSKGKEQRELPIMKVLVEDDLHGISGGADDEADYNQEPRAVKFKPPEVADVENEFESNDRVAEVN